MPARNPDRQAPRRRRDTPPPAEGIYALDHGIIRIRHSKSSNGWYAHRMQVTRHGRVEWSYIGQLNVAKAVLLPVDPDNPVPCTRCPEFTHGKHSIAGDILCNGCLTAHLQSVSV